jgi:transposase-like protein
LENQEKPAKRPRRKFSDEFKRDAVEIVHSSDKSIAQVARELGIYDSTLGNWVKQDEINRGVRDGVTTAEREEVTELRRENARLRIERELLKRAVAFWVRESVRHEALMKRAVMKGHRGLVVAAAG